MKEDDIENYFKFLDLYKSEFLVLDLTKMSTYMQDFVNKYHKMQIRANFLQTRAA
jgi:hypothetical protein